MSVSLFRHLAGNFRAVFTGAALCVLLSAGWAFGDSVDARVRRPSSYGTFSPPAAGTSYADPEFGTTVLRLSNAAGTPDAAGDGKLRFVNVEYSTMSPFNRNNTKLLLQHQSYFGLYDGRGRYIRDLPFEIHAGSEPRWSRHHAEVLYYIKGNQLKTYDVSTGASRVVRTFFEYGVISGRGESDISFDGDHFVFVGDDHEVFVYEISTDRKLGVFDTGGRGFDSLYITPENNVTITWHAHGQGRYRGIELFDRRMNFLGQVTRAGGHMDVTRDIDGSEVLVWVNAADTSPVCNNGIVKVRLSDGHQTCLLSLDWSLAIHISAPDASGRVFVETYAPSDPTPTGSWAPYTNEVLEIKLDGSEVRRLAHHRSRPFDTYNWTPRVSSSRDGSLIVYNSNFGQQARQPLAAEYGDAYLIRTDSRTANRAASPPAPPLARPAPETGQGEPASGEEPSGSSGPEDQAPGALGRIIEILARVLENM